MKSLGDFLLEKRIENKDQIERGLKQKYIGNMGELFALKYLDKLFRTNGIRNYKFIPPKNDKEYYDLEIYLNSRTYKIEVKFSMTKEPNFGAIHFKNKFKYLLLIWHPSYDKIYFAFLTKKEARKIAISENAEREYEDNWRIHRISIFEETNKKFLKKLSELLELNKELEDLEDSKKLSLIEDAKEQIIKQNPEAQINDFKGITYQRWTYEYFNNFTNEVEIMPYRYKYDIEYKGKRIEIKYSSMHDDEKFIFKHIKTNDFEYIFFIGFDKKENKFYFEIKSKDEFKNWLEEHDNNFKQNGIDIHVPKSFLNFGNDFNFEDFDNYIETH